MSACRLCVPAFVAVLLLASPAPAQQFVPTGRDTLRGLPGVEVLVEPLDPVLQQGGLDARQIRTEVTRQLSAAGVPVYASQTENPSTAKPFVYVLVSGVPLEGQGFAVQVQVHLRQTLRSPVTGSSIVNAMTWDQHTIVVVPPGRLSDVGGIIEEAVTAFAGDWRAVH